MIYALCRKIDFVENLRVFGVKIWTEISIRVKNLTFSMSGGDESKVVVLDRAKGYDVTNMCAFTHS